MSSCFLFYSGLGTLVVTYVDAINSGGIPCLENAVTTLAHLENSAAMQKAADYYSEQMAQRLSLPTDTLQELLEVHTACEREAIVVFMNQSFKDENQDFQKKLLVLCLAFVLSNSCPSGMTSGIVYIHPIVYLLFRIKLPRFSWDRES